MKPRPLRILGWIIYAIAMSSLTVLVLSLWEGRKPYHASADTIPVQTVVPPTSPMIQRPAYPALHPRSIFETRMYEAMSLEDLDKRRRAGRPVDKEVYLRKALGELREKKNGY